PAEAGFFDHGVPTGIRTPVATVKGLCPWPLDDGDRNIGGARRDRTADLLHAMQALSQLSYGPTAGKREIVWGCATTVNNVRRRLQRFAFAPACFRPEAAALAIALWHPRKPLVDACGRRGVRIPEDALRSKAAHADAPRPRS